MPENEKYIKILCLLSIVYFVSSCIFGLFSWLFSKGAVQVSVSEIHGKFQSLGTQLEKLQQKLD